MSRGILVYFPSREGNWPKTACKMIKLIGKNCSLHSFATLSWSSHFLSLQMESLWWATPVRITLTQTRFLFMCNVCTYNVMYLRIVYLCICVFMFSQHWNLCLEMKWLWWGAPVRPDLYSFVIYASIALCICVVCNCVFVYLQHYSVCLDGHSSYVLGLQKRIMCILCQAGNLDSIAVSLFTKSE